MQGSGAKDFSTLGDYVAVLRRRKGVILISLLVVPAAAVLFSLQQAKVYEASADVLLTRSDLAAALTGTPDQLAAQDPERFAQTQAALARVGPVLQHAVRRAGMPNVTPGALSDSSSVEPVLNADLLRFHVRNHSADAAVRLVNAYAGAYTRYHETLTRSALDRAKLDVTTELERLRTEGVDPNSALVKDLQDKQQQLTILQSLEIGNTAVVQKAESAGQVAPRPKRNAILGVLFGAVLGIGLAFVLEALDRGVRSHEEIERALEIPLLGRLPRPRRKVAGGLPVMLEHPYSEEAGAVRRVKATLELANLSVGARTIMVTSAVAQEGKSTTVANLAVALAQGGHRVVVIDADIDNPTQTDFFPLDQSAGLTDIALGKATVETALVAIPLGAAVPGTASAASGGNGRAARGGSLEVIQAGTTSGSSVDVLGSRVFADVVRKLRNRAAYVLVDAPPLLGSGAAMALSAKVDAMLLVVKVEGMDSVLLEELRRATAACPATKLGFIVAGGRLEWRYGYGYSGTHREALRTEESFRAGRAADT